jgi:apolipoprotein N-acyltransferase
LEQEEMTSYGYGIALGLSGLILCWVGVFWIDGIFRYVTVVVGIALMYGAQIFLIKAAVERKNKDRKLF